MNCSSLKEYLRRRGEAEFGCVTSYEQSVSGTPPNYSYMCGHYKALLEQVLDLLPTKLLEEAIRAADNLEMKP